MYEKIISVLLSASMLFTLSSPAFAADISSEGTAFNSTDVLYSDELNGRDIAVVGTDLYVDGEYGTDILAELVANEPGMVTIESANAGDDEANRRTSWVYGTNCPFGSPSDYTRHVSTEYHNISLRLAVTEATVGAVVDILVDYIDMDGVPGPGSVLWTAASSIADAIVNYILGDKLYAREEIYGHKNGMGYIHKNYFYFYSDSNYSDFISSCVLYSQWA